MILQTYLVLMSDLDKCRLKDFEFQNFNKLIAQTLF